jgi:LmbE family N-acetylglucosaminyl deacetylase
LLEEGFEPWRVKEVWMSGFPQPDHWVDITDTFDLKLKVLREHASQTNHIEDLEGLLREWGQRNAGLGGLPEGRIAESFKIVNTN